MRPYGAEAPPVGLAAPPASPVGLEVAPPAFCSSVAGAPPELPASPVPPLGWEALPSPSELSAPLPEEPSLLVLVVLVAVVAVDVVWTAARSALVSVGGVISGVLLGTGTETLLPPQALSVSPLRSATHAASATLVLTGAPCAYRTSGSR